MARRPDQAIDVRVEQLAELGTFSTTDLMATELPEPRWIIEPYLTEGFAILAGKPKIGKSWMALGLTTV